MAKTPAEVNAFLADLEQKLRPLGLKERDELLELKRAEHERRGLAPDDKFNLWDYRYYDRVFVEKALDLGASFSFPFFFSFFPFPFLVFLPCNPPVLTSEPMFSRTVFHCDSANR